MDAKFVRKLDWTADARLYKLSEPVRAGGGDEGEMTDYVIVSAVYAYSGPETLVFPARADGEAINAVEIAGGRGYMDHDAALDDLANLTGGAEHEDTVA